MNIRDLHYYNRLCQDKNFTKVARFFKVSQPTITAAIQRLEKELDAQLIIRDQSHNALTFTDCGKQFAQHATQMLQELKTAQLEISAIKHERVRLGLPPIIGSALFPALSARLSQNNLLGHLDTHEDGSKSLLNQLKNGQLDLALLGSTTPIQDDQLSACLLARKPFKVITSPAHPLAKNGSIRFNALVQESFIQLNERFVHSIAFNQLSRQAQIKPKLIYQTNDVQIIKGMVAKGVGISLLSAAALLPQDPVAVLTLRDQPQPEFLIQLVYRSNHLLTNLQQEMIQLFMQENF
ncbi:LysR substrate-binding domain-containing protein [Sporolactobacillus inulinus]|uniref:LysR family transcriptional regulator n=1 Tax=Sporolactobacillus inulinus CASD TaxID=1069536 RepID=A0A0U1QSW9_9BACL|nr:LysR substrate-binding domain-containing protein [Sporolactobacillus inulinus]KLI03862.1 LysR family transcriptional regulator [Sporolactobacillus inulinus CASD]GEB76921.1 LysR family transcriptional regulator [Sporolactobacillus inulinus]